MIPVGSAMGHHRIEQLGYHRGARQTNAHFPGHRQYDIDIFAMRRDLAAGLKIVIQHALTVQFQNPALGISAHDGPAHLGRIDTGFFCKNKGFGDGLQRQADDDLIGGFGHLPGAMIADVIDIFP